MRADADFMVYVGARWPTLVRSLVLLGCPPGLASDVAADALSRCREGWAGASRHEDVDRLVYRELVVAWDRVQRHGSATASVLDDGLEAALSDLPSQDRRDLVLARYAGVPTTASLPRTPGEAELRDAVDAVPVLAPPGLDDLRALTRRRRRDSTRRALVLLVPVLLVVGGLAWWTARSGDDEQPDDLGPARLTRAENAAGVVWHRNGELHLDHAVLELGAVRDLTAVGTGAVYGDDEGRVLYVADDGGRTVLGHKDPDVPVMATDENGWAAWLESEGADAGRIVVKDAAHDRPVAVLAEPGVEPQRVVAVDGEAIYFTDAEGAHAWLPVGETVLPVTPADLLDVRSRIKVFQIAPTRIEVVQSMFMVVHDLPGTGAQLSKDGNLVVTRSDRRTGEVTVYDTRSGEPVRVGLADDDLVLDAANGGPGRITYVVQHGGDLQREIRTCELRTEVCEVVDVPADGGVPVLAR